MNKTLLLCGALLALAACKKSDDTTTPDPFDTTGQYTTVDQMARPAIATVFVSKARKDEFNTTTPTQMAGKFNTDFQNVLTAFGYTKNALGMDKATFAGALVTDVLNVATNKKTTFFDGTNVLTGRTLDDDVIDVELLLIFGGPTGALNPGLTSDNVSKNDKSFLATFPYMATPW